MFIRNLSTTLLENVLKYMLLYEVFLKSMTDPDDMCEVDLQASMG